MTSGWSLYHPPKPKKTRPKPARPRPAPVRPVRPHFVDPFAPQTDAQLQAQAGAYSKEQLQAASAIIEAAMGRRSAAGQAAISGLTQQLGGLWQGAAGATKGAYDQATAAQSGINSQLANRLGSFGQNLQGEVGNKLAYAGPSGQQVASNTGTAAQGTANAGFAKGSAGTEMLNAQSAAAQATAAGLPAIAGLTGLQNSRSLQAQINKDMADALSQAAGQSQSSAASMYQHLVDRELQKAIAKQSGLINQDKLTADIKYKQQTLAYKQQKARYDRQLKLKSLGISQQRVKEYARHNGISEQQASQRLTQQAINERNRNKRAAAARAAAAKRAAAKPSGFVLIPPKKKK